MESRLHPDAREFLDQTEDKPPKHTLSIEKLRQVARTAQQSNNPESVDNVETIVIRGSGHGISVRIYTPTEENKIGNSPLPVFVWAHGGGFILGDIETEDAAGRALANATGCIVASVDYRLAPENPFPAALQDMFRVIEWMSENANKIGGSPGEIIVGGASAGGNLAAASTLLARERGGPELMYQVLAYPAVSYEGNFESRNQYDGYFITNEFINSVNEKYLSDPLHGYNPLAYPLQEDDFTNLPSATIISAGFDPMLDETNAYATALEDAGVDVTQHHYEDMIHSFFTRIEWVRAREAISTVGDDIRNYLKGDSCL